ncbi:MAG: aminoacyl-tRNA hydrolase [Candidatus Yonathbacteria bacterium]|nr:aminoacyl-tRNA hydrolase [Candidatus Yonathbacteria bacterium]NTW47396.1 aminoacyl-tRNA hydrolase [Candidatus Yonathbacteria bacterium]
MEKGYVVVGLGNPGKEYEKTPHNAGRLAVEHFATVRAFGAFRAERAHKGLVSDGTLDMQDGTPCPVTLLLPETFMNASGKSVITCILSTEAERLIVIHDDVDIPLGTVKVSRDRGAGGHNGIASIIKELGTASFIRVRVGVAPKTVFGTVRRPTGDRLPAYVLKPVPALREKSFMTGIVLAGDATEAIIRNGVGSAMNTYNGHQ